MSEERVDNFDEYEELTDEERAARKASEVVLDENDQAFVDNLLDRLMTIIDVIAGHPLYPYQRPCARRMFESLIIDDGALITAVFSRQSGKSELVADVVVTAMIFLPILARVFPEWLDKFKDGLWVGAFAPVEDQADTLYGRIVTRMTSESTREMLADPEISIRIIPKGKVHQLSNGSLVRRTSCHPRTTIEGKTYHLILIDEAQGAEEGVYRKSVSPMGASTNATTVMTGTPTYETGMFYHMIQQNKREMVSGKRSKKVRQNHFEVDYREASKANKWYAKYVNREMIKYGPDSDEFKLSYRIMWLLDQGMFTTTEALEEMGDTGKQTVVRDYTASPVVVGIDVGRKQDKTVVTVVWVGWERTDQMGFYEHYILDWLDLGGVDWEEQYYAVAEFLSRYNVWKVGIDENGLGDVFIQRLELLMPQLDIVRLGAAESEQSERWKYLKQLLERRMISWPAGAKVKRLRKWRRFYQEMQDLQLIFKGAYVKAEAPNVKDAHDDYPDSLAMACILTKEEQDNSTVEQYRNMFYSDRRRRRA